jgi:hypothetical protein
MFAGAALLRFVKVVERAAVTRTPESGHKQTLVAVRSEAQSFASA